MSAPVTRRSAALFCSLFIVAVAAGCPTAPQLPSSFGLLCNSSNDCADDTLMCRPAADLLRRCLPPRVSAEGGDNCEAPVLAVDRDLSIQGSPLVDEELFFGAATDDAATACAGLNLPDMVVRFTVDERAGDAPGTPQGVVVSATGGAAVELRTAGCDGAPVRFGCAPAGGSAIVAALAPGSYDLVVERPAADVGGVDEASVSVRVDRLDCPTGAVPFDAERCLRTSTLPPSLLRRTGHTMHGLKNGGLVLVGGRDEVGTHDSVEVLDPTSLRWVLGDLALSRVDHASVLIDETVVSFGGGTLPDNRANLSIVELPLLDSPVQHATFRRFGELGAGQHHQVTRIEGGNTVVLSTEGPESGVIFVSGRPRCGQDNGCERDTDECIAGVCACRGSRCSAPAVTVRREILNDLRVCDVEDCTFHPSCFMREGVTIAAVAERFVLITGLGPRDANRDCLRPNERNDDPNDDIPTRTPSGLVVLDMRVPGGAERQFFDVGSRRFGAIVPLDARRVWFVGGVDEAGTPSTTIDEIDLATGTLSTPVAGLRPVPRPRVALLGEGTTAVLVVIGDDDLPQIIAQDGRLLPAPLITARVGAGAAALGPEAIAIAGGEIDDAAVRTVERLELVARRAPLPAPLPTCDVVDVTAAVATNSTFVVSGDTSGSSDRFRSKRCDPLEFPYGRDLSFSFSLATESALRIIDVEEAIDDSSGIHGYRFMLLRGDCDDFEELACGDTDRDVAMYVPRLPPGEYTLVADYVGFRDVFDENAPHGGSIFTGRVVLGPPDECAGDPDDPADDVVGGARLIEISEDGLSELTGVLCGGDVDHVLYEHWGSGDGPRTFSVDPALVDIRAAIVDEAASVNAGRPVPVGAAGEPFDDLFGAPVGYYLVRLAAAATDLDRREWLVQDRRACNPDIGDSLLPALDNRQPGRAPRLGPGESINLALCGPDVDTVVVVPGAGGESSVEIDDDDVFIEVFSLVGDGAAATLGAPIPVTPIESFFSQRLELGVLSAPVAVRISQRPESAADFELSVSYRQAQAGDSCRAAIPLTGSAGSEAGDTTLFGNDLDEEDLGGCTGFGTPGPDVVWSVELQDGETLTAEVVPVDNDEVGIYLLNACPSEPADVCEIGDDSGGRGESEDIAFTNERGAAATYFLVVDSFFGSAFGYTMTWSIAPP